MRLRPGETRAGCGPPLRQTVQILSSPDPTASGTRGISASPRQAPGVSRRFRLQCGIGASCPFSLHAPGSGILMGAGNRELERSAPPGFRFYPDSSALTLDSFPANRKTDAGTRNFASMQTFKQAEHAVGVLRINADSVVPHRKQPPFRYPRCRDMDSRCLLAFVLD